MVTKNCMSVGMILVVALVFCTAVATAHATITTPLNGSFENPADFDVNGYSGSNPTSWTVIEGGGGFVMRQAAPSTTYDFTPGNGVVGVAIYSMESNNHPYTHGRGVIQQLLGTMVSGETYTFNATLFGNKIADWSADGYWSTAVHSYRISFRDVTKDTELVAITEADFNPGKGINIPATFIYNVDASHAGDQMALRLAGVQPTIPPGYSGAFGRTGIDKVTVTTTIPEPSTLVLLATGLVGLLARRRRRS